MTKNVLFLEPITPAASGGNCIVLIKILGKKFNLPTGQAGTLLLVKQNLTALPSKGGIVPCKLKSSGKKLAFYLL